MTGAHGARTPASAESQRQLRSNGGHSSGGEETRSRFKGGARFVRGQTLPLSVVECASALMALFALVMQSALRTSSPNAVLIEICGQSARVVLLELHPDPPGRSRLPDDHGGMGCNHSFQRASRQGLPYEEGDG